LAPDRGGRVITVKTARTKESDTRASRISPFLEMSTERNLVFFAATQQLKFKTGLS
jgi:hypothetical protein